MVNQLNTFYVCFTSIVINFTRKYEIVDRERAIVRLELHLITVEERSKREKKIDYLYAS